MLTTYVPCCWAYSGAYYLRQGGYDFTGVSLLVSLGLLFLMFD